MSNGIFIDEYDADFFNSNYSNLDRALCRNGIHRHLDEPNTIWYEEIPEINTVITIDARLCKCCGEYFHKYKRVEKKDEKAQ